MPTMTTAKGGEFAIVMPVTHHDTSDRVAMTDRCRR
jgi:DNA (cytosine-5)-methyltransferase 1